MPYRSSAIAASCALLLASIAPAAAQPAVKETTAGPPLSAAEAKLPKQDRAMIGNDAAAKNLPSVDQAFANSDGIRQPDAANTSPGSDRLTAEGRHTTLVTSDGSIRLQPLIGSPLYSSTGQTLGHIRDVLLSPAGPPQAVVALGDKLVVVPWSKLVFGLPGAVVRNAPMLPGGTRHALQQLPSFSFTAKPGSG